MTPCRRTSRSRGPRIPIDRHRRRVVRMLRISSLGFGYSPSMTPSDAIEKSLVVAQRQRITFAPASPARRLNWNAGSPTTIVSPGPSSARHSG